jgi:bla regulator protein blaR1
MLAALLMNQFQRPVVDETGLTGSYQFDLRWTPDPPAGPGAEPAATGDASAASLPTALQEQLGLKLESRRRPVEAIVIESVERPSEN